MFLDTQIDQMAIKLGCNKISAMQFKAGQYAILKDHPCKAINVSKSKLVGKTGTKKCLIEGISIINGKKYEDVYRLFGSILSPIIVEEQYQVANIDEDNFVSLITKDGSLKQIKLPTNQEQSNQLKQAFRKYSQNENNQSMNLIFVIGKWNGQQFVLRSKIVKLFQ